MKKNQSDYGVMKYSKKIIRMEYIKNQFFELLIIFIQVITYGY